MKKLINKVTMLGIAVIMLFSIMALSGCSRGFEIGFIIGRGDWGLPVAVRSNRTEFDISNVTPEFFFGWRLSSAAPLEFYDGTVLYPTGFALYFNLSDRYDNGLQFDDYTNVGGAVFIRKIYVDDAVSGNFAVREGRGGCNDPFGRRRVFSHSETITIPYYLFISSQGSIRFHLRQVLYCIDENVYSFLKIDWGGGGRVTIPFEIIGENRVRLG